MTKTEIIAMCNKVTGGLSNESKMPSKSFGLPAKRCHVGQMLAQVEGTVCEKCYSNDRGHYQYPVVKEAQERRYKLLYHPMWVGAMTMLLWLQVKEFFRWQGSGDIDSLQHLCNIVQVCENTPHLKHWMPTKEKGILKEFLKYGGVIPDNLVISMSGYFVDGGKVKGFDDQPQIAHHLTYNKRNKHGVDTEAYICPVEDGLGFKSCDEANCSACWNPSVRVVAGALH